MIGKGLVWTSKVGSLAWSEADARCVLAEMKYQGRKRRVKLAEHRSLNQAVLYVLVSIMTIKWIMLYGPIRHDRV